MTHPINKGIQAPWGTFRRAAPKNRPSRKPKKRSQATAKNHGLRFTYGIWIVIIVVVTNMTVATANLEPSQEGGSGEYKVCAPVCVAQASKIREYKQKGNRPDADCGSVLSYSQRRDTTKTHEPS